MSLVALEQPFELNELDQRLVELYSAKEYTKKTNKQIATELGISEQTFYKHLKKDSVKDAIVKEARKAGEMLLPLAVDEARKILESSKSSDTSKTKIIQLVFQSGGLTKSLEEQRNTLQPAKEVDSMDLDKLMLAYGIKKNSDNSKA